MNNFIVKYAIWLGISIFSSLTYANISSELLHQTPKNIPIEQRASIQGFLKTSKILRLINARIYITYINDKATLDHPSDWDKVYDVLPGPTNIRFVSDTPNYFTNHQLNFTAKSGQRYQIKNNQADINPNEDPILFWIENIDTGEAITPKEFLLVPPTASSVNLVPIIISK